jgi:hypothetical protein
VKLLILLGTVAIVLPFIISQRASRFGYAVSERFLERPTSKDKPYYRIPSEPGEATELNRESLVAWMRDHGQLARGYASKVIPIDIAYLLFLGGYLGYASELLAEAISWPFFLTNVATGVVWCFPVAYIMSDLTEDTLIGLLLGEPERIEGPAYTALAIFRQIKLATVTCSFAQVLILCLVAWIFPAG